MVSIAEELLVEETELSDYDEPQNIRNDIMSYPADYTLRVIYEKWQSGQIVIPDFQRNYVWNETQASRLIESFLLELPIPQVFLYRVRSNPLLTVIDGQQRLGTIARFYDGKFALRGVAPAWADRKYAELLEYDREILDDATLRAIIIRQINPDDHSSAYQIFHRLNTGGTRLNDMEIRRAIFRGEANGFLLRLNENADWRALIGMPGSAKRFRDVELILRVLALAENWRQYGAADYGGQSMKSFMNHYMQVLDQADGARLEALAERFARSCAVVHAELGDKPFHLYGPLNLAVLDAVMACAMELGDSLNPDLRAAYAELQSDPGFVAAIKQNTSHALEVQQRFNRVHSKFGGQ